MRNYCKCTEVGSTYKSFAGDTCCSECFTCIEPIEKIEVKPDIIFIKQTDQEYIVMKNGEAVESFNKLAEDYAFTMAEGFARKLRREIAG